MKGRKRHIAVDTSGLLLGIVVPAANIQDADGAGDLLAPLKALYCWLTVVLADRTYHRISALVACALLNLTLIIVSRLSGTKGFVVLPRRWGVERTLGWLGRWRRLSKDYGELPDVSEAMVTIARILPGFGSWCTDSLIQIESLSLPPAFETGSKFAADLDERRSTDAAEQCLSDL